MIFKDFFNGNCLTFNIRFEPYENKIFLELQFQEGDLIHCLAKKSD
jgi:hypothetical protein